MRTRTWPARRWMALLGCAGLLATALAVHLPAARAAHPRSRAQAAGCSGGGSSGTFAYGGGVKIVSESDVPACATGHVIVTFAGSPAAGCAARGVCAYSGSESFDLQEGESDLNVSTLAHHGRRTTSATLFLGGSVASSVARTGPSGASTSCSDQNANQAGFFSLSAHGGRVDIRLAGSSGAVFGTRCAGPLTRDVAAVLPRRTVSLAALRRGRTRINLTGGGSFAANGFAGTVRSTVVVTLGRPHRQARSPTRAPPGVTPQHYAEVVYRIVGFHGQAVSDVRASANPAICGPFDACGLAGTITVSPGLHRGGTVFLSALAPVRRPVKDLLTALGVARDGNPAGIRIGGFGAVRARGQLVAALTQAGTCRDQVRISQLEVELSRRAGRLLASISPAASQAADPLRTRCPGPDIGNHALVRGSLPLAVLHRRQFTVRLTAGGFRNGPYRVTTRSSFVVTLRREHVRVRVEKF